MQKALKERIASSASTNSNRIHITSRSNGWAIRKEGNKKATFLFPTQAEAIRMARQMVKSGTASRVVVHGKDGSIKN